MLKCSSCFFLFSSFRLTFIKTRTEMKRTCSQLTFVLFFSNCILELYIYYYFSVQFLLFNGYLIPVRQMAIFVCFVLFWIPRIRSTMIQLYREVCNVFNFLFINRYRNRKLTNEMSNFFFFLLTWKIMNGTVKL